MSRHGDHGGCRRGRWKASVTNGSAATLGQRGELAGRVSLHIKGTWAPHDLAVQQIVRWGPRSISAVRQSASAYLSLVVSANVREQRARQSLSPRCLHGQPDRFKGRVANLSPLLLNLDYLVIPTQPAVQAVKASARIGELPSPTPFCCQTRRSKASVHLNTQATYTCERVKLHG